MARRATTKLSTGISRWSDPEVPMRTISSEVFCGLISRVFRSMFLRASSSLSTMSMLSGPMPVESTVKRFPRYTPVQLCISRFSRRSSTVSKWAATRDTRAGSPTRMTRSASSCGARLRWYTRPSGLTTSSDSFIRIALHIFRFYIFTIFQPRLSRLTAPALCSPVR